MRVLSTTIRSLAASTLLTSLLALPGCISKGDTNVNGAGSGGSGGNAQTGAATCTDMCGRLQSETFDYCGKLDSVAKPDRFQSCIAECQKHLPNEDELACALMAHDCTQWRTCGDLL